MITIEIPIDWLKEETELRIKVVAKPSNTPQPHCIVERTADPDEATPTSPATTLKTYTEALIRRFQAEGRTRVAETYAATLRCYSRTMGTTDIHFCDITPTLVQDFERRMLSRGPTRNTTSFYLRILRAIYNRAVAAELTPDRRPFAHVFTGKSKTRKRALPLEKLRKIADLQLDSEREEVARLLFMFSYFTRGMSFVDMALLRKDNLKNGKLTYRRQKTGQLLTMAWRPEMQQIAERLPSKDGSHLLGILDDRLPSSWRKQCHARQQSANEALKHIGKRLGLPHELTMYVARHSWASIAKQLHVPMSIISDGMGHHSERTTQIYLADIDTGELDKANDLLIEAIHRQRRTRLCKNWPVAKAKRSRREAMA